MSRLTIQQAFDLAFQHHQRGGLQEAEQLYRQILAEQPNHADALHFLGVIAHQAGHNGIAVDLINRSLVLKPSVAEAHCNLGCALRATGQLEEAIAACHRAITLKSDYPEAHYNLGVALGDSGQIDQSIAAYRDAIAVRPHYAEAHYNLGCALHDRQRVEEAIEAFSQAIVLKPDYAEAHYNLGNSLRDKGQIGEAIAAFRHAIATRPNYAEARSNLGTLLKDQGQLDEAIATYRQAIALKPDYAEAHYNLGNALKDSGRIDAAIGEYRQALELRSDFDSANDNLLYALHFHPAYDASAIAREHSRWNHGHGRPLASQILPHQNDRSPTRRLRVGYVSGDFRLHPVGQALLPVLEQHDAAGFEIFCFSNVVEPDAVTWEFQTRAHGWRSLVELSDQQAADLIRGERIDILVDLSLHMSRNRLLVFARRPAPVQVTWLGYPSTTGLSTMDYRVSDPFLDPLGADPPYVEKTVRLPHSYLCWRWRGVEEKITPLPALANGYVTFGSLNNFSKVAPEVLTVSARILCAVPTSRLMLRCPEGETSRRVCGHFAERGVAEDRLEFIPPWVSRATYTEQIRRQDICLDPFPYPGHTTSCDALWMGVPVVTLTGATAVARGGVSLLSNLGLPELIANDREQYIAIAVELANNSPRLAAFRATLRHRMEQSPLMDAPKFARDIEAAYRLMWRKGCETNSP